MIQRVVQHTPGPWFYEISDNCESEFTIHSDYSQIGMIERWNGDDDQEVMAEAEANARLVAAAPDLLEALEQAVQALNTAPRFAVPHLSTDSYQIAAFCDHAIIKVKGI